MRKKGKEQCTRGQERQGKREGTMYEDRRKGDIGKMGRQGKGRDRGKGREQCMRTGERERHRENGEGTMYQ